MKLVTLRTDCKIPIGHEDLEMGYTTEFEGSFMFDQPLTSIQVAYINKFAETRRMLRSAAMATYLPDDERHAVGLPIGTDGEYFVGGAGFHGQDDDESVIDRSEPPRTQPEIWCQWVVAADGESLLWDGSEKFTEYIEWLEYLIANFFQRWGRVLSGAVAYEGEDAEDAGTIVIEDNKVIRRRHREIKGDHGQK